MLPELKPFLLQLREAKGSKLKLKILEKTVEEFPALIKIFRYCFDYSKAWGIADKTLKKVEREAISKNFFLECSNDESLSYFLKLCEQQKISQKELIEFTKMVSNDDWYFYKHILSKDLKSGVGIGLIKRIIPDIKQFLTQAANKNLEVLNFKKNEYVVEPKLDGVRCIAVIRGETVTLYSRNGKQITNFLDIERELLEIYSKEAKEGIVIDGELLTNKNNFRQLMQTLYSLEPKPEIVSSTKYNSFDCLSLEDFESQTNEIPLRDRQKKLKAGKNWVTVVESKRVFGREEVEKAFNSYVEEGYEGIMIKNLSSSYAFKRNDDWIKLKPSDEYTFTITGFKEGSGKYAGKLGSFCGEYIEDVSITVDCGSGLSDEERIDFWERREELLGMKIDIASDGILETGSLRFPIFVRLREDL